MIRRKIDTSKLMATTKINGNLAEAELIILNYNYLDANQQIKRGFPELSQNILVTELQPILAAPRKISEIRELIESFTHQVHEEIMGNFKKYHHLIRSEADEKQYLKELADIEVLDWSSEFKADCVAEFERLLTDSAISGQDFKLLRTDLRSYFEPEFEKEFSSEMSLIRKQIEDKINELSWESSRDFSYRFVREIVQKLTQSLRVAMSQEVAVKIPYYFGNFFLPLLNDKNLKDRFAVLDGLYDQKETVISKIKALKIATIDVFVKYDQPESVPAHRAMYFRQVATKMTDDIQIQRLIDEIFQQLSINENAKLIVPSYNNIWKSSFKQEFAKKWVDRDYNNFIQDKVYEPAVVSRGLTKENLHRVILADKDYAALEDVFKF